LAFSFLALTLLATWPGTAEATRSRVIALGGTPDYLTDEVNVLRWYASLLDHGDLVVLETGDFDFAAEESPWYDSLRNQGGGIHLSLDPEGRLGTFAAAFAANLAGGDPCNSITVLYGKQIGPVDVGTCYRSDLSLTSTDTHETFWTDRSEFLHNIGLGVSLPIRHNLRAELAGEIMNAQFTYRDNQRLIDIGEVSSWASYGLRTRVFFQLSQKITLVPVLDYFRDDRTTYTTILEDVALRDARQLRVGLGGQFRPSANNLILLSTAYRDGIEDFSGIETYNARFHNSERDYWCFHSRIGLESRAKSWLTIRGSLAYIRCWDEQIRKKPFPWSEDIEFDANLVFESEVILDLGLGLTWQDFTLDLVLADGKTTTATFLQSQVNSDPEHFLSASLRYDF